MPVSRAEVDRDIEATLGLVPEFFRQVPDYLIPTEWASFKSLELSDQTAIPNKYKELIGLAVSGATRCRYCCYFHTEAATVRRQRGRDHRDRADRQEHDGLEHLPEHAAIRLRPVHDGVRQDRGARA